ncbi:cation:proton antiporter [Paenibacillus sambharensis]|uniref:Cation:proton antiporter n=1 Tax=Paenibacillus sambharensis TaxID=1803190 RepID=A0A2W1LR15_9BACL|nr:cation:proton antiporter [Paenibacillus sambharensis]PZD97402.1 cation:proton antiporter [Paenibacillus sambharensis]
MNSHLPFPLLAGLLLLFLFVGAALGNRLRIPGVIIFILTGLGLSFFLTDDHLIHTAAELGIILLFFLLGLEFPAKRLLSIASRVWRGGMLDILLSLGVTALICILFGLNVTTSLLIAGLVYATSSSITAKLLENTKRLANAESEFILALLIFEDLVAPIVVVLLVTLTSGEEMTVLLFLGVMGKVAALTAGAVLAGRYVFAKLRRFIDRNHESDLFVLFSGGSAFAYGGLALYLGLSEVLGAFLAGLMLAEARQTEKIEASLLPMRNLLLPFFFVYFGTTIVFDEGVPMPLLLGVILLWSIAGKIATGYLGGRWYGLNPKPSLRAGLSLVSRGEFSVIIAALAADTVKPFAGIYIICISAVGIILFQNASRLSTKLYGGKSKAKRGKIAVPKE